MECKSNWILSFNLSQFIQFNKYLHILIRSRSSISKQTLYKAKGRISSQVGPSVSLMMRTSKY